MRRFLLLSILLISITSWGQVCDIDFTQTAPGIYPDTMPVGYVGQLYDEDITFVMPLDTQGFDFTNFEIVSISLPVGLTWECNNASNGCNYDPQVNQYGCVNVTGTPLLAGEYQVDVSVLADLTVADNVPTTFSVFMEILDSQVPTSNDGFSMIGANGCTPQTVEFTNNNPGLLAYSWDFGNGNTSTAENPTPQVYNTPGEYEVVYQAWESLDTTNVYTLTGLTIQSMSGYGEGFPSFEVADAYYVIYEDGDLFSQSGIVGDTDPPISWTANTILDPTKTYSVEIWESDAGEILFGADDLMGSHTINISGCTGCSAGSAVIDYTIDHQVIYPSPSIVSVDTVNVNDLPVTPIINYDQATETLTTNDEGYSYQWYLEGNAIAGSTDTMHLVMGSGVYSVAAISGSGCVSFSDTLTVVNCIEDFEPAITSGVTGDLTVDDPSGYSIQWYVDGVEISGATGTTHTPTQNGEYTAVLNDGYGCEYTSNGISVLVGVNEMNQLVWNMYPNPAKNTVTLSGDLETISEIRVIDMMGRELVKNELSFDTKEIVIDVTDIQNGSYIVMITGNNNTWSKPLRISK